MVVWAKSGSTRGINYQPESMMSRQSKMTGKRTLRDAEGGPRDRHLARLQQRKAEHGGLSVRLSRRGKRVLRMAGGAK